VAGGKAGSKSAGGKAAAARTIFGLPAGTKALLEFVRAIFDSSRTRFRLKAGPHRSGIISYYGSGGKQGRG
jgi:hypothetical protein